MTGRMRALFLTVFVLMTTAGAASSEDALKFEHKFSLGVLTSHGEGTLALDYVLGCSAELWTQPTEESFRKNLSAHVVTRGALAADPELNTSPLTANAGLAASINLYRPSKVVPGVEPGTYETTEKGFNLGRLHLSLLGAYETDQRLDNRNFTGGLELGYVLTENRGLKALVPSVFVGYDLVLVDSSKLQRTLGVDDGNSRRLRVFASWKLPVGQWLPGPLEPLNGHLDLRYYRSDGVSAAERAREKDEATYAAGALSYSFSPQPLWGVVNAVFVRITDGRIPPVTNGATAVTAGLTLWEK